MQKRNLLFWALWIKKEENTIGVKAMEAGEVGPQVPPSRNFSNFVGKKLMIWAKVHWRNILNRSPGQACTSCFLQHLPCQTRVKVKWLKDPGILFWKLHIHLSLNHKSPFCGNLWYGYYFGGLHKVLEIYQRAARVQSLKKLHKSCSKKSKAAVVTEVAQRLIQNKQQQRINCCSLPLFNLVEKYANCKTNARFPSILCSFVV